MSGSLDDLDFIPVSENFVVDDLLYKGDVTVIARARERSSGKLIGIQRPIPLLRDDSADAFRRQAETCSSIFHPNILHLHSVARDDEGVYGVVEWADGGSLAERLRRSGPLQDRDLRKVARGAATALAYAEGQQLAHGAIIPENLFLGSDGLLKIAGYGLRELREKAAPFAMRTRPIDGASDLADLLRTLWRLASTAPARDPSALALLPKWLREVVERGLGDSASDRFRDARELLAALRRLAELENLGEESLDLVPQPRSAEPEIAIVPDATELPTAASETVADSNSGGRAPSGSGSKPKSPSGSGSGSGSARRGGDEFPWRELSDQYRIDGTPKRGGMGSVVRAVEISTGRVVAIKRMHRNIAADDDSLRRFHREAASVARLNHPHVLQLLQAARDREGDYLVLEWAEGGSLNERLSDGRKLPLDEVLAIARKIGGALVYAHGKKSIHRDIKPHNILLSETGEPKLADFGLARSIGDETLTTLGGGAGSPHYMAPEQWQDSRHADERSDLFSFAKTLYHLATGRKPISVDADLLPRPIKRAVMRCLEEDPAQRYAGVQAFLDDLPGARPAPSLRRPVAIAATLVVAAVGAMLYFTKDAPRAPQAPDAPKTAAAPETEKATPPVTKAEPERTEPPLHDSVEFVDIPRRARVDQLRKDAASLAGEYRRLSERLVSPLDFAGTGGADDPDAARKDGDSADLDVAEAGLERAQRSLNARLFLVKAALDAQDAHAAQAAQRDQARIAKEAQQREAERLEAERKEAERIAAEPKAVAPTPESPPATQPADPEPAAPDVPAKPAEPEHVDPWAAAIAAIADPARAPAYAGLAIRPQIGLTPLRFNRRTGLHEFLVDGTGAPPRCEGDGPYAVDGASGIVLVLLPGGEVHVGAVAKPFKPENDPNVDPAADDSERPTSRVKLQPFFLAAHEVTAGQWQRLTGKGEVAADEASLPIANVTWLDAKAALESFHLLLPTEAQWEYGCRAGTHTPYWCGAADALDRRANLADQSARRASGPQWPWIGEAWLPFDDGFARAAPAGRFEANAFGLHDVIGNVWEWCRDDWLPDYQIRFGGAGDGLRQAISKGSIDHPIRGGSFAVEAKQARSATRLKKRADYQSEFIGLRAARPLLP